MTLTYSLALRFVVNHDLYIAGKTSAVQYLAHKTNNKLKVINLNQQSDATDLLGGFKPVEMRTIMFPLREEFEGLFVMTMPLKNHNFLQYILVEYGKRNWNRLLLLMIGAQDKAVKIMHKDIAQVKTQITNHDENLEHSQVTVKPTKSGSKLLKKKSSKRRQGTEKSKLAEFNHLLKHKSNLLLRWRKLRIKLEQALGHIEKAKSALAFSFIEGALSRAITEGTYQCNVLLKMCLSK